MNILEAVSKCRKARPDLPMVGVSVEGGAFTIQCFPNHGKGSRKDWHKDAKELASGLTQAEAIRALQVLASKEPAQCA